MNDRPPLIVILVLGLVMVMVLVAFLFLVFGFLFVAGMLVTHYGYTYSPHVTHI
jgi:hypothetical protein